VEKRGKRGEKRGEIPGDEGGVVFVGFERGGELPAVEHDGVDWVNGDFFHLDATELGGQ